MPRGEETQEVPREGKEESKEVQESKPEAKRDAEVVAAPEAVIERERPVAESEAIEKELVQAVEAVGDGGPKTEAGESQVTTSDEVLATPINTPGGGDEVSATPINIQGGAEIR